ncbi:MAG: hypothetical protein U9M94_00805 [Patescibacteria group bacterium]|nr:hypothetical protein [Patescibacteria group bacterium]
MQDEYNAPYGYARRQDALRRSFPALEESEIGGKFFCFYRASDVNAWLLGAIAWLEFKAGLEAPKAIGNGDFTEAGKRHFKCGCDCQTRVTKSEWKQYQAGKQLEIYCSACGVKGIVQKAEKAENKSKSENSGLNISALKAAWS